MRETRLIDMSNADDPNVIIEAGSTEEADMLAECDRYDLVIKIQELDKKLFKIECVLEDERIEYNPFLDKYYKRKKKND